MLTTLENKSLAADQTLGSIRNRIDNLPAEQRRLAARLSELRKRRGLAVGAVEETRILASNSLATAADLARAQDALRDLDHDLDQTALALDDLSTTRSVLERFADQREAAVRAELVGPLASDALRISEKIALKLQELRPLVEELQALDARVNEFSRFSTTGFEIFDKSLTARGPVGALVRFFTGRLRGGFNYAEALEQFQGFVDDVRSRVK